MPDSSQLYQRRANVTSQVVSGVEDFSLVLGGPLYQLYRRARLLKPPVELLIRRMVAIPLIAWGPLFALSLYSGTAIGGVAVPFLFDLDAQIRFLVALPMLIGAELVVHYRMKPLVQQFVERGIIAPEDEPQFKATIDSIMRARNSIKLEVILLVVAVVLGNWLWRRNFALGVSTWYGIKSGASTQLTPAGYWYAWVSLSIFRFILLRWYARLLLWYRFLWKVRGLPLRLNLFHPDRAGGLGFLSGSVFAFAPVLQAHTFLLAGIIGDRIWHTGAGLLQFKVDIFGVTAFLLLLIFTPLLFFGIRLSRARRSAMREYGILASHYVNDFRNKWTLHGLPRSEPLLGTSDLQSFADLANGFEVVRQVRLAPLTKEDVMRLTVLLLLPLVPLVLTLMPLDELIGKLLKIVL